MEPSTEKETQFNLRNTHIISVIMGAFIITQLILYTILSGQPIAALDLTTDNIANAINDQRSLRDIPPLNRNADLEAAAQFKADDMMTRHYFSHTNPEGQYIWPTIVADGYTPYLQLGENLAIEFYDTDSLINAWMNSPEHRANILNDGFKDQGMGVAFGNTQTGQYHSAIANTFGELLITTPTARTLTVSPTPKKPAAPTPTPPPAAPSVPAATPVPVVVVTLRGPEPNFTVYDAQTASTAPAQPSTAVSAASKTLTSTIQSSLANTNPQGINRYLVLIFGFLLLITLASDIKYIFQNKINLLDKRVNNIWLLIMSLIVVAVAYWM